MAEKTTKKRLKKVAVIQLNQPEGLQGIDDGGTLEVENWPEDGRDNIIPIGKAFQCSIHLANRLVRAGRIQSYSIQTIEI